MNKEERKKLEDVLNSLDMSEKTEYGEVAKELFMNTAGRTNITQEEMILLFINKAIFEGLRLEELSPVDSFLELKKSVNGWNSEQFVKAISGNQQLRSGGGFLSRFGDMMLRRRE